MLLTYYTSLIRFVNEHSTSITQSSSMRTHAEEGRSMQLAVISVIDSIKTTSTIVGYMSAL